MGLTHILRGCVAGVALLLRMSPRLISTSCLVAGVVCGEAVAAEPERGGQAETRRSFDLPRGDAATTLSQFAGISGTQIVFMMDKVRGQRTNAVKGEYSPREALDCMLAGTALSAWQDTSTGAFVISREAGGEPPAAAEKAEQPEPKPAENTPEPMKQKNLAATLLGWLALALSSPGQAQTAGGESPSPSSTTGDTVIELSPFVASASSDVGYMATSSLAGTRINAELKDLGAAISVVTKEFMDDVGATSMENLLVHTTSTEVGGAEGNFTNSNLSGSRPDQQGNRQNPEGNTRVRGLVSAEVSRDFFITDFGFDSYNVERVDISRGPNSVLFGVGSPGGVINYSSKRALLGRDRVEYSLRADQRGSFRTTLDVNQVVVPRRVALRLNGLIERHKYRQEPAYQDNDRGAAALESVLFENRGSRVLGRTTFRANVEFAEVQTTPPNVIAPVDNIRYWYDVPDVASITASTGLTAPAIYTNGTFQPQAMRDQFGANPPYRGSPATLLPWFITVGQIFNDPTNGNPPLVGFTDPASANLQAVMGRVTGAGAFDWLMQSNIVEEPWTTGFKAQTLTDTSLYNWVDTLISGKLEGRDDRFRNRTFALEQLLWGGRAGVELAYNQQDRRRRNQFSFSDARSYDIWLDNNLWLGNRQPDPNAGRPLMISRSWGNHSQLLTERETKRATGFVNLDVHDLTGAEWTRWLGRHVLSGIVEQASRYNRSENYAMAVSSDEINMEVALQGLKNNIRRQLHAGFFVGPDLRPVTNYEDVRLNGYIDVPIPQDGDRFTTFIRDPATGTIRNVTAYADQFLTSGNANRRVIDTEAVTWQSYLLKDTLVGLFGYRKDRVRDTLSVTDVRLADGALDPASLALRDTPSLDTEGETTSWSVVAHYPRELFRRLPQLPWGADFSLFYSKSENFTPVGFRQDVFLKSLPPPEGETEERGFNLSFLDNKVNFRVNWYETVNTNIALDTNLATASMAFISGEIGRLLEAQRLGIPFGKDIRGRDTGLANHHSSYEEVLNLFVNMVPEPMKTARDLRLVTNANGVTSVQFNSLQGLTSSSNLVAKGMEIEMVANPTRNWTMIFNVAKQETVRSGSGAELQAYYSQIRDGLIAARMWDEEVIDEPNVGSDITYKLRLTRDVLNPLAAINARDGTVSQEQRKWRYNFTTSYKFNDNALLRGFAVGGSLRWQDRAAVGYPIILVNSGGSNLQVPDLANPYLSSATWNGDVFVRYKRRLTDKIDWTIQLNARNVLGDDGLTPELINPDGSWAVVRAPVEKTYFLTNTFSF